NLFIEDEEFWEDEDEFDMDEEEEEDEKEEQDGAEEMFDLFFCPHDTDPYECVKYGVAVRVVAAETLAYIVTLCMHSVLATDSIIVDPENIKIINILVNGHVAGGDLMVVSI
ncbi:hypothetical protein ACJX0J_019021, partial [Zea mays]